MYGKLFASTFTGSMCGAGPTVFAVWSYVVANTYESCIELNPRLLAGVLGTNADEIRAAIEFLCRPDSDSRNPEHEGRRLLREGQYQYRVVSHAIYRAMRDDEALRAYNRDKQRESRARRQSNLTTGNVNDCQAMSIQTDTDTEATTEVRTLELSTYRTSNNSSMSSRRRGKSSSLILSQKELEKLHEVFVFVGSRLRVPWDLHNEWCSRIGETGDQELREWYITANEEAETNGDEIPDTYKYLRPKLAAWRESRQHSQQFSTQAITARLRARAEKKQARP